jgi:hypothetical protein
MCKGWDTNRTWLVCKSECTVGMVMGMELGDWGLL